MIDLHALKENLQSIGMRASLVCPKCRGELIPAEVPLLVRRKLADKNRQPYRCSSCQNGFALGLTS